MHPSSLKVEFFQMIMAAVEGKYVFYYYLTEIFKNFQVCHDNYKYFIWAHVSEMKCFIYLWGASEYSW